MLADQFDQAAFDAQPESHVIFRFMIRIHFFQSVQLFDDGAVGFIIRLTICASQEFIQVPPGFARIQPFKRAKEYLPELRHSHYFQMIGMLIFFQNDLCCFKCPSQVAAVDRIELDIAQACSASHDIASASGRQWGIGPALHPIVFIKIRFSVSHKIKRYSLFQG